MELANSDEMSALKLSQKSDVYFIVYSMSLSMAFFFFKIEAHRKLNG